MFLSDLLRTPVSNWCYETSPRLRMRICCTYKNLSNALQRKNAADALYANYSFYVAFKMSGTAESFDMLLSKSTSISPNG